MNATDEELNNIYASFVRHFKEMRLYCFVKKHYHKSNIKSALDNIIIGERDVIDNFWSKFNRAAREANYVYHGPKASLWYLSFIFSDSFKNAFLKNYGEDHLNCLIEAEQNYFTSFFERSKLDREEFIKSLNEEEVKLYKTYINQAKK